MKYLCYPDQKRSKEIGFTSKNKTFFQKSNEKLKNEILSIKNHFETFCKKKKHGSANFFTKLPPSQKNLSMSRFLFLIALIVQKDSHSPDLGCTSNLISATVALLLLLLLLLLPLNSIGLGASLQCIGSISNVSFLKAMCSCLRTYFLKIGKSLLKCTCCKLCALYTKCKLYEVGLLRLENSKEQIFQQHEARI